MTETIAITGSKKGDIKVWKIDPDHLEWELIAHHFHHEDMVSNISVSKMGMFVTSSLDGTVNLYTMDKQFSIQRTFYNNKFPVQCAVIC